ncbi:hypothetical protein AC1031_007313 [Aphanomyces cochlioides]|nr:hypothetical protein AC1031_007313 [Aphanomyces cochlioides]
MPSTAHFALILLVIASSFSTTCYGRETAAQVARNACVDFVCKNTSLHIIYGRECYAWNVSKTRECSSMCPNFVSSISRCCSYGLSCVQACMRMMPVLKFP